MHAKHSPAFRSFAFALLESEDGLAQIPLLVSVPSPTLDLFNPAMLVLRLQRVGRENTPAYRVVVSEKARSAKKGKLEILGHFHPSSSKAPFTCDLDRAKYWISMGAQPSDTVARLLGKAGLPHMEKFFVRYAKQRSKKAPPEGAPVADAQAPAAA